MIPWLAGGGALLLWLAWTAVPWFRRAGTTDHSEIKAGSVLSIQEVDLPDPPENVAELYVKRLRRLGGYLGLQSYWSEQGSSVRCLVVPLIRFGTLRREDDREILTIGNGLFSRRGGTLAFVRKGGKVRIELRGFRPRMTLFFYKALQLPLHRAMGRSFLAWLARRSRIRP